MEFNKSIVIAADCDEIITNISPLWSKLIHDNADYFGKYFNLIENFDYNRNYMDIMLREEFYLNKFFMKKDIELSEAEQKILDERFFSLYNNEYFYKMCKPTKIAMAFLELLNTNYVSKLYIVSSTMDKTLQGKKDFIGKLYKERLSKVEFIPLEIGEKKSEVINNIGNVNVYYDDELKHVYDVIENTNKKEMDIYIPKLGYNFPNEDMVDLSLQNNKNILYYNFK